MVGWPPNLFLPRFPLSLLNFLSSCCQNVQLELLFPLLSPLLLLAPSCSLLCPCPQLQTPHQTPVVTPGMPVHRLKGTFMEIFKVRETSKRATLRVLEHWHNKSTLEGDEKKDGERQKRESPGALGLDSPGGCGVPSN